MYFESDLVINPVTRLVAVLFLLAGCATAPVGEPSPEETEAVSTVPTTVTAAGEEKAAVRLTIAAVGDMMLGTDYPENHLPDDDGVGFLATVTPLLSSADITFGNLEGDGSPTGAVAHPAKNDAAKEKSPTMTNIRVGSG